MDVQLNTLFIVTRGASVRRDHETLKKARRQTPTSTTNTVSAIATAAAAAVAAKAAAEKEAVSAAEAEITKSSAATTRTRRPPISFSDTQVEKEMDVAAVEKTRSYRTWMDLPDGTEFVVRVCVPKALFAIFRKTVNRTRALGRSRLTAERRFLPLQIRSTIKSMSKDTRVTIGCCARTFGAACATVAKTSKWSNA